MEDKSLTQSIMKVIEDNKPRSVQQLVGMVMQKTGTPENQIIDHVVRLQNQRKILLYEPHAHIQKQLVIYLRTLESYWYWTTVIQAVAAALSVLAIPENAYPLVYFRYSFGAILILWLPGYSFIRAVFPSESSLKRDEGSDFIERIALSIGMSLALTAVVGSLLNYTTWGIRLAPVVISLFSLTIVFATVAMLREHKIKTEKMLEEKGEN